jgi:hypothetical protein
VHRHVQTGEIRWICNMHMGRLSMVARGHRYIVAQSLWHDAKHLSFEVGPTWRMARSGHKAVTGSFWFGGSGDSGVLVSSSASKSSKWTSLQSFRGRGVPYWEVEKGEKWYQFCHSTCENPLCM